MNTIATRLSPGAISEIMPGLKRAAIMFNPNTAPYASTYMPSFETAARSLKVAPITAAVHTDAEIEMAITALGREPEGGLVVMPNAFMTVHRGMSRFLLNIEKRSLSWLTLCGVGLASKNAMQDFILVRVQSGT